MVNASAPTLLGHIAHLEGAESAIASTLWCLSLFLIFGWSCSRLSENTLFPSFTLQLLIGIVLHDALAPLAAQMVLAVVVCTALAAIILKSGGDEIERREFLKIAFPTVMIAVVGFLVTFLLMCGILMALGLDGKTAALLSAIIGSTDPAAVIPTLKRLVFKTQFKRITSLSVAESAVNDAVGAIFTASVASILLAGGHVDNLTSLSASLFSSENLINLGQQFLFGTIAGLLGWAAMHWYEKYKSKVHSSGADEAKYDFAIILAVPLVTFLLAQGIHGNGFLAAFIAGLMANFNSSAPYFHGQLHNLETQIESVAKPTIFMMVGPFVSLTDLADTAVLGFIIAMLFMFVARPAAVMVSLLPTNITLREKLFMCSVRETGVIPVVLAVVTVSQFPDLKLVMPLTAWIVVWTLTLLPALTPWWSKKLDLVK
jgi:NhaP-type Na+/H+ or K+/H+ antiporter